MSSERKKITCAMDRIADIDIQHDLIRVGAVIDPDMVFVATACCWCNDMDYSLLSFGFEEENLWEGE